MEKRLLDAFLKRHPFIAIQKVDDAAILIAAFFQAINHDNVFLVGVDTDVGIKAFAIVQYSVENAMRVGRAGDAVDDMIGFVVEPLAVVDDLVGDVGAGNQGEGADNRSCFICHYVAAAQFDVVNEFLIVRVAVGPLEGVAVAAHNLSGLVP